MISFIQQFRSVASLLLLTLVSPFGSFGSDLAAVIYEKAAPSVFLISRRDAENRLVSFGTGFLISKDTLITNAHVVQGGNSYLEGGSIRIPARVEKFDFTNDLAVLKVNVELATTPLILSERKTIPGESIFAIGNPEGLEKSMSTGIVAAVRDLNGKNVVQITAPISHGSSGGPVLDSRGEVIGITVAMLQDGQNLNFAVPAEKLRELISNKRPESKAVDFTTLFREIDQLQVAEDKVPYSDKPNSEWQKDFLQIEALLNQAMILAEEDPELTLKVAEEASGKNAKIFLLAAQLANDIGPTTQSNMLLGKAWRNKAYFAEGSEQQDFLLRAETAFRSGLKLTNNPTSKLYYDLADVLEDQQSMEEANAYFRRALELSKRKGETQVSTDSVRGLARTTYSLNKLDESDRWFSILLNTGFVTSYDWEAQADRLKARAKYKEAGVAYRNSASLGGEWLNWCRAADSSWIAVSDEEALSSARGCINAGTGKDDSDKAIALAHNIISDILRRRGVFTESLSHAREATDLDPTNASYFESQADALYGLRRFQEAINASNQALRLSDGKYSWMHFRLGSAYFELENWQFAKQSFELAASLDPTDTASAYNTALCYKNLGYTSDAVKWFREVLKRDPKYEDRAGVESQLAYLRSHP